jgi:hypothetical protein
LCVQSWNPFIPGKGKAYIKHFWHIFLAEKRKARLIFLGIYSLQEKERACVIIPRIFLSWEGKT